LLFRLAIPRVWWAHAFADLVGAVLGCTAGPDQVDPALPTSPWAALADLIEAPSWAALADLRGAALGCTGGPDQVDPALLTAPSWAALADLRGAALRCTGGPDQVDPALLTAPSWAALADLRGAALRCTGGPDQVDPALLTAPPWETGRPGGPGQAGSEVPAVVRWRLASGGAFPQDSGRFESLEFSGFFYFSPPLRAPAEN
jgi:hypothetical protein